MNTLELQQSLARIEKMLTASKKVLNFDEACDFTGISRSFMYKLTSSRRIPHTKPNGKLIFFEKEKLETWLLSNERKSTSELEEEAIRISMRGRRF